MPSIVESNPPSQPSPTTFPRFNALPLDLRLMIWELALEPSIIPLHVHTHHVKQQDDDNDNQGIPPFKLRSGGSPHVQSLANACFLLSQNGPIR
jgi:hypothetical protein